MNLASLVGSNFYTRKCPNFKKVPDREIRTNNHKQVVIIGQVLCNLNDTQLYIKVARSHVQLMPSSMVIWNSQFWFSFPYWDDRISRTRHLAYNIRLRHNIWLCPSDTDIFQLKMAENKPCTSFITRDNQSPKFSITVWFGTWYLVTLFTIT